MIFEITRDGNGFINAQDNNQGTMLIFTENIKKEENKSQAYLEFLQIVLETLKNAAQNSKVLTQEEKREVKQTLEHINSKIKEKSKTL